MLKFTAIALVARDMATHRTALGMEALQPWIDLAKCLARLGELIVSWRRDASLGAGCALGLDMQTAIMTKVDSWYAEEVEPLIRTMRMASVKTAIAAEMDQRKNRASLLRVS